MTDERRPRKPTKAQREGRARLSPEAEVVALFGPDRFGEAPMDPDAVRPQNDWIDVKDAVAQGESPKRKARARVRMGRRWTELMNMIDAGEITMREFVKTLTPEELVRGQMKAEDGTFRGAPPKWIPAEFHAECTRELLKRGDVLWKEAYLEAIKVFMQIARDENLDAKDRLKASQYIIERIAGKTPEKVEVSVAQPWETLISGIVAEAEDEAIGRAARVLGGAE